MNNPFDRKYFNRYEERNIIGMKKGSKPFLNSYWSRKIKKHVPAGSGILEVGCGYGYFLEWLEGSYKLTGIDISEDAVNEVKSKVRGDFSVASAESLPFKDGSFRCLIAFDVIGHLDHPDEFFSEANRVLEHSGCLVISTPNPESLGSRIKKKDGFAHTDQTHINVRRMDDWRAVIRLSGFAIISDGTDTLWDAPYFKNMPKFPQKLVLMPAHWLLSFLFGYFPWRLGENYVCVARKRENSRFRPLKETLG